MQLAVYKNYKELHLHVHVHKHWEAVMCTVEPLYNGHFGTYGDVHCTEGTKATCIFNELARTVISLLVML